MKFFDMPFSEILKATRASLVQSGELIAWRGPVLERMHGLSEPTWIVGQVHPGLLPYPIAIVWTVEHALQIAYGYWAMPVPFVGGGQVEMIQQP